MAKRKSARRSGGTIVTVNAAGQKRPARRRRAARRSSGRARRAVARYRSAPRWKQRAVVGAAASALGYLSGTQAALYSRVPSVAGFPVEATIAVGAHFLAKGKAGLADDIATAAAAITGYKLGKAGFSLSGVQVADLSDLGYDDGMGDMADMAGDYDDGY